MSTWVGVWVKPERLSPEEKRGVDFSALDLQYRLNHSRRMAVQEARYSRIRYKQTTRYKLEMLVKMARRKTTLLLRRVTG